MLLGRLPVGSWYGCWEGAACIGASGSAYNPWCWQAAGLGVAGDVTLRPECVGCPDACRIGAGLAHASLGMRDNSEAFNMPYRACRACKARRCAF